MMIIQIPENYQEGEAYTNWASQESWYMSLFKIFILIVGLLELWALDGPPTDNRETFPLCTYSV